MQITQWLSGLAVAWVASTTITGAMAADVAPISYSYDQQNSCGTWCNYYDPQFTKLTDGVTGNAGWALNQGQEWVGWNGKPVVNIDFNFAPGTAIDSISIGSTQDNLGDVVLPSFSIFAFESGSWALKGTFINPASSANDNSPYSAAAHSFSTLSGLGIVSDQVRVSVMANGPWSFVDEVQFTSVTAVPEPETYALLLAGLGIVGAAARRRKAKQA